jgi:CRISPR-associated protein Cas1
VLDTIPEVKPVHNIDLYEDERDGVLLPAQKTRTDGKARFIPAESVEALYTFGEVRFNTQFFRCVSHYSIPVHMFNYYGNYLGSFLPMTKEGDGSIQLLQYEAYRSLETRLYLCKSILESAMKNILANLKSYYYEGIPVEEHIIAITGNLERLRNAQTIEEMMGFEGATRNMYYDSWNVILRNGITFEKRIKQPPIGIVNSLLSFGNSMLYGACISEIYRTRLNPFIGFLHECGDKKHPLAYDISEIFKPIVVDRVIFRCINLGILNENDFKHTEKGFYLKDNARKKFVEEFEKRLSNVIHHKRLNRRISYRSLIRMECYNLINYLTGKISTYEPYRAT